MDQAGIGYVRRDNCFLQIANVPRAQRLMDGQLRVNFRKMLDKSGNRNQQHAAARILLARKATMDPLSLLSELERAHGISRRTLQRTRAKLARLGLIEHVTWMNSRFGGQEGWKLSGRGHDWRYRRTSWR